MKTCKICGETKAFDQFHKDRQKTDGHALYCKPCFIAKQREYASRPPKKADPEGFKTCQHCKALKPLTAFNREVVRHDGLRRRCKTCDAAHVTEWRRNNLDKAAKLQKEWRQKNPNRSADYSLRKNYGIELGTYDKMLAEQEGRCAICGTTAPGGQPRKDGTPARFHVDHCHDSGKVRGLLCHNCNVGIGNMRHSKEILEKAIAYVKNQPNEDV